MNSDQADEVTAQLEQLHADVTALNAAIEDHSTRPAGGLSVVAQGCTPARHG
ncbi:hypothetical protein [Nocardia neocaledoniensis]|uniref:hypothetical protein n=1 Tax=Nocardia neocaledoniensis TaxID=236511 RepID=UPI0024582C90|nr:hypothetical protein [Nocardia neocaledoniensis]